MESSQQIREVVVRGPVGAGLHDLVAFGRFEVDRCTVSVDAGRVSALVELDPDSIARLRDAGWAVEELSVAESDNNDLFASDLVAWAEQWGLPTTAPSGGNDRGRSDGGERRS